MGPSPLSGEAQEVLIGVLLEKNPHRVETVDVLAADQPFRRGPRTA